MRSRFGANCTALMVALSFVSSGARAETYICQDENGKREVVKTDIPRKTVSLSSAGCTITFHDGITSTIGEGASCMFLVGDDPVRQFVTLRNRAIVFGVHGPNGTVTYTLDMDSGLLDMNSTAGSSAEDECHRPHA